MFIIKTRQLNLNEINELVKALGAFDLQVHDLKAGCSLHEVSANRQAATPLTPEELFKEYNAAYEAYVAHEAKKRLARCGKPTSDADVAKEAEKAATDLEEKMREYVLYLSITDDHLFHTDDRLHHKDEAIGTLAKSLSYWPFDFQFLNYYRNQKALALKKKLGHDNGSSALNQAFDYLHRRFIPDWNWTLEDVKTRELIDTSQALKAKTPESPLYNPAFIYIYRQLINYPSYKTKLALDNLTNEQLLNESFCKNVLANPLLAIATDPEDLKERHDRDLFSQTIVDELIKDPDVDFIEHIVQQFEKRINPYDFQIPGDASKNRWESLLKEYLTLEKNRYQANPSTTLDNFSSETEDILSFLESKPNGFTRSFFNSQSKNNPPAISVVKTLFIAIAELKEKNPSLNELVDETLNTFDEAIFATFSVLAKLPKRMDPDNILYELVKTIKKTALDLIERNENEVMTNQLVNFFEKNPFENRPIQSIRERKVLEALPVTKHLNAAIENHHQERKLPYKKALMGAGIGFGIAAGVLVLTAATILTLGAIHIISLPVLFTVLTAVAVPAVLKWLGFSAVSSSVATGIAAGSGAGVASTGLVTSTLTGAAIGRHLDKKDHELKRAAEEVVKDNHPGKRNPETPPPSGDSSHDASSRGADSDAEDEHSVPRP